MNLIRISAEDERLIARAASLEELQGIRGLVNDRIAQAKVLKSFGKVAKLKDDNFGWRDVARIFDEVMPGRATRPPFPEYTWFQRMSTAIKRFGMDEGSTRELAEYCKTHLREQNSLEFMVMQQRRILDGEFSVKPAPTQISTAVRLPELPDE